MANQLSLLRLFWSIPNSSRQLSLTHGRGPLPACIHRFYTAGSQLPTPPAISSLESTAETAKARSWISQFQAQSIPRSLVELNFSRSSGPGGQVILIMSFYWFTVFYHSNQNVNKVNTKTTLRCSADANWIPMWARADLRKSVRLTSHVRNSVPLLNMLIPSDFMHLHLNPW
jgi:hypothetical protein